LLDLVFFPPPSHEKSLQAQMIRVKLLLTSRRSNLQ
jgi:hypothetical protein